MDSELTYKEQQDALNNDIQAELVRWQEELGTTPEQAVIINSFVLDAMVFSIVRFLIESKIIDEDKFMVFYKGTLLKNMQGHFPNVQEAVQQARREAIKAGGPLMAPNLKKLH